MSSRKPVHSTRARSARPLKRPPVSKRKTAATELRGIRDRLALAMAIAYLTAAALKAQQADLDDEAAIALQRHIGDEIGRQLEQLDTVIAGGAP